MYDEKPVKYYSNITSKYSFEKELINSDWLINPVYVEFEGNKFKTINSIDDYLTKLYGNYMELPPENERIPVHEDVFYDVADKQA